MNICNYLLDIIIYDHLYVQYGLTHLSSLASYIIKSQGIAFKRIDVY